MKHSKKRYQVERHGQSGIQDTWNYENEAHALRSYALLVSDFQQDLYSRFYDDVLLIDTHTGTIIDSYHNHRKQPYVA